MTLAPGFKAQQLKKNEPKVMTHVPNKIVETFIPLSATAEAGQLEVKKYRCCTKNGP